MVTEGTVIPPGSIVAGVPGKVIRERNSSRENRVNALGVVEPLVQTQGERRIIIELPGVEVVVLRFAEAYGSTVDTPFARLLRLPSVPVAIGRDPLLQLLAADDVVRCLEHAIDDGRPGTYNVAPEGPLYLSQILRLSGAVGIPLLPFQLDAAHRALAAGGLDVPDPDKLVDPPTARFMVGFNDPRPAAVVLTELEIMQPSMTPRPQARAVWIMRRPSRMPPALSSLMLTIW